MGIPRLPGFDQSLALLRKGYAFIPRRCNALKNNGLRKRLMMRDVVCLRGPEASRLPYGQVPVTRVAVRASA
jgi:fatty-acid peroxygenase